VKHSLYSPGISHGEELVVGVDHIGLPSKDVVQQGITVREGHRGIDIEFEPACFHVVHTVTIIREPLIADGQQPYLMTQQREHGHLIHHYGGYSGNRWWVEVGGDEYLH